MSSCSTSTQKCVWCSVCFEQALPRASYTWQEACPMVWYFSISSEETWDSSFGARLWLTGDFFVCWERVTKWLFKDRSAFRFWSSRDDFPKLNRNFSATRLLQAWPPTAWFFFFGFLANAKERCECFYWWAYLTFLLDSSSQQLTFALNVRKLVFDHICYCLDWPFRFSKNFIQLSI